MKIKFCGAAKIVTGSCYLVEANNEKVLIDCGMFQGSKEITRINYEPFIFNPKEITTVFLTHAHIDHAGLLPKLKKAGFKGKIYATPATIDLCEIMLKDSANVNRMDTEFENKQLKEQGLPLREPLYTEDDVKTTMPLFEPINYKEKRKTSKNFEVKYNDAGHIIGSAIIELFVYENNKTTKIVFSGDLGQWDVPIIQNPTMIDDADYILVESTYGNRKHEDIGIRDDLLLKEANETFKNGGKLMIPSFAIERTQELLYSFNKLIQMKRFPNEKIFLDSPLAIKATEVFKKHKYLFDEEAMTKYKNPFNFQNLVYCKTVEDSKKINNYKKPCIIIAGAGMCNGGRIRHHIKYHIGDPKNKLLFVGYQAEGTLGRYILEGAKRIKMMGTEFQVKAKIAKINSFSAHADINDLMRWMNGFKRKPKKVFIIHGEDNVTKDFKKTLEKSKFICQIPNLGEEVVL